MFTESPALWLETTGCTILTLLSRSTPKALRMVALCNMETWSASSFPTAPTVPGSPTTAATFTLVAVAVRAKRPVQGKTATRASGSSRSCEASKASKVLNQKIEHKHYYLVFGAAAVYAKAKHRGKLTKGHMYFQVFISSIKLLRHWNGCVVSLVTELSSKKMHIKMRTSAKNNRETYIPQHNEKKFSLSPWPFPRSYSVIKFR